MKKIKILKEIRNKKDNITCGKIKERTNRNLLANMSTKRQWNDNLKCLMTKKSINIKLYIVNILLHYLLLL